MVDLGETSPDFTSTYTNSDIFPADLFFNKSEWVNRESILQLKREDESSVDFKLQEGFQLTLRSCAQSEQ